MTTGETRHRTTRLPIAPFVVLALMALLLQLWSVSARAASRGPTAPTAPSAGLTPPGGTVALTHGGLPRTYVVRVPPTLVRKPVKNKVPLVVVLHGGGGNAANAEKMTGFTAAGAKHGFVVVYPNGSGGINGSLLTWNAKHCCGSAMRRSVDDVAFIDAMLRDLLKRYPIDERKIFITGMSNGAMMAHRLGIELSSRIAAVAPVVGAVFGDEQLPASTVSAFVVNGALDQSVPTAGGISGGLSNQWDGTPMKPSLDQAAFWARANGCDPAPAATDPGPVLRWTHACPTGLDVVLTIVKDNGHAWPGGAPGSRFGDEPSTSFDATEEMWRFFMAHPKRR